MCIHLGLATCFMTKVEAVGWDTHLSLFGCGHGPGFTDREGERIRCNARLVASSGSRAADWKQVASCSFKRLRFGPFGIVVRQGIRNSSSDVKV